MISDPQHELLFIISKSENIAKTLMKENNPEMVELAVKSSDRIHRIAAAFYYGHKLEPSECLFNLMADQDPLVVDAARLACINIANKKYVSVDKKGRAYQQGHIVDFGPWMYRPGSEKKSTLNGNQDGVKIRHEAIDLWRSFFEKKEAGGKKMVSINNVNKGMDNE